MTIYEQVNRASIGGLGGGLVGKQSPISTARETQVPVVLGVLVKQTEMLDTAISELLQRLGTVLRTDSSPNPKYPETTEESLVPMADQVRTITRRIEAATASLRDIIDRIEL